MSQLDGAFHRGNECHHQVARIGEELWGRHMQWSSADQIWPGSGSGLGSRSESEWLCSAFLGAGAYHMTMTGKWISFGLPKYLCIVRIDFDFAAVSFGLSALGPRPEIWRALFMGSMNQRKSVKQVYDTFLRPPPGPALLFGFRQAVDILIWQPSMAI